MKKRVLKKWVQDTLIVECVFLFCLVAMCEPLTFYGLVAIVTMMMKFLLNILILKKYGNVNWM